MTGNGTQASPYVPGNWDELKTASETDGAYVKLAANTKWDMNDQYPSGVPSIGIECNEIDFNGAEISNIRAHDTVFSSSKSVTFKNGIFNNMYVTGATFFSAVSYSYPTRYIENCNFSGEFYNGARFSYRDGGYLYIKLCSISLYLSAVSDDFISASNCENTAIKFDGTINGSLNAPYLMSSAIYGSLRGLNEPRNLYVSGETSVIDLQLQNFSTITAGGWEPSALLINSDKLGTTTVDAGYAILATTAQMHDAAWLNAAGFPCRAG